MKGKLIEQMFHDQNEWLELANSYQCSGDDFLCHHSTIFSCWWHDHAGIIRTAARRFLYLRVEHYPEFRVLSPTDDSPSPLFASGVPWSTKDVDIRLEFLQFVAAQGITDKGWQTKSKPNPGKMRDAWL